MRIVLALLLLTSALARGEDVLNTFEDACGFWCTVKKDLSAPVTHAKKTVLTGTGITLTLLSFRPNISEPLQRSWQKDKPLDDVSRWGDAMGQLVPNALYAGGMALYAWRYDDDKSTRNSILMLRATAYAAAVCTAIKYSARELRPDRSDHLSFPSGHSTTAFTFASVVQQLHGWKYGAPAYALAAFVGASRINDNKHFLHDVAGGATIGIAYGIGMTELYEPTESSTQVLLLPTPDFGGTMVQVAYEF